MNKTKNQNASKIIKALIAISIGTAIALLTPFEGLEVAGMRYIGILTAMIMMMVFRVLPEYVLALAALAACVVFKVAPFGVVFGQFAQETIWMTFLFVAFATGLVKSGLLTRIAYTVLAPFPESFKGQVLAIMTTSVIISPLIPNPNAKLALMGPITGAITKENNFEKGSKGASGLFTAMFIPTANLTMAFMTGTAMALFLIGFLPEQLRAEFTFVRWLSMTFVWYLVHLILTYFFIIKYYKPDENSTLTKGYAKEKLKSLGAVTSIERTAIVILVITILMWITQPLHGISIFATAMLAFIALSSTSLFQPADFQARYPWPLIMTLGTIMAVSSLLTTLKINTWLAPIVGKIIGPYITNVYVLIIAICLIVYILRYAIISIVAVTIIVYAIFGSIAATMGIHPIIVLFTAYMAGQVYNLSFHNVTYLQAVGVCGWDMVEHKKVVAGSYAFMVIQVIASLASIPFWKIMGFIK